MNFIQPIPLQVSYKEVAYKEKKCQTNVMNIHAKTFGSTHCHKIFLFFFIERECLLCVFFSNYI